MTCTLDRSVSFSSPFIHEEEIAEAADKLRSLWIPNRSEGSRLG